MVDRRWRSSAPPERLGQGVLDHCLGVGVEVCGGFVEEDDAGAGQEQAGDGEPLAFAPDD